MLLVKLFFLSELPARVCQHAAGGLLYSPVIILLRTLFIAAIKIIVWSFEKDLVSVLYHSPELLKIFGFEGELERLLLLPGTSKARCKD